MFRIFFLFIAFTLIFPAPTFVQAKDLKSSCSQEIRDQGKKLSEAQIDFYDRLFQTDLSPEEKIETASQYLRFIDTILESILAVHERDLENADLTGSISDLLECQNLKKEVMTVPRFIFRDLTEKSLQNRSLNYLEASLAHFNEQLNSLSRQAHHLFQGKFQELFHKMPCFAKDCIQKKYPLPSKS